MDTLSPTLQLTFDLILQALVILEDKDCQTMMMDRLRAIGFTCEPMRFEDVDNFWARLGNDGPVLAFAGHTDVVPTGNLQNWTHPPSSHELKTANSMGVAQPT